jgi:DNA-binding NtrC family response regulator
VRELEHLVEKMVVLSEGEPLTPDDLPPSFDLGASARSHPPGAEPSGAEPPIPEDPAAALREGSAISLAEVERHLLGEAIRISGGNLAEAAKRLGLSYKTMRYRAHKFGLAPGQESP